MAYPFKMGYAVGLTFFVAARHPVPLVSGQVSVRAEAKVVPCPLQGPELVDHPARQRHVLADGRDLVERFPQKFLIAHRQLGGDGFEHVVRVRRGDQQQQRRQQQQRKSHKNVHLRCPEPDQF